VEIQSRSLTYLTLLYRKQGQVEATQAFSERSITVAKAGQMLEYIGMAKANQAWVAWRRRDLVEARNKGQEALITLEQVAQGMMFRWTALWPLVGVSVALNSDGEAIDYARTLLDPKQNPPPPNLASVLAQAIEHWGSGHSESARTHLQQAVELASASGFL
jgi:hypothetical protein